MPDKTGLCVVNVMKRSKEVLKKLGIKNRKLKITLLLVCTFSFVLYGVLFQRLGGVILTVASILQWNAVYVLLPIIYSILWIPIFVLFIKIWKRKVASIPVGQSVFQKKDNGWPHPKVLICLATVAVVVLALHPYLHLHYEFAIGIDTPGYICKLERISSAGFSFPLLIGPAVDIFFTFIFFFPLNMLGLSWNVIFKYIIPIAFGMFYVLITYFFVKNGTNNKTIASLSALFASVSFYTLNLATTLFKNYLALSLLLLFLTCYVQFLDKRQSKYLWLLMCINTFLFMQYLPFAALLAVILVIFIIMMTLLRDGNVFSIVGGTLKIYIPAIVAFIGKDVYNFFFYGGKFVKPAFEALPYFLSAFEIDFSQFLNNLVTLGWVTSYQNWWRSLFVENLSLLILSVIGILILCLNLASDKDFNRKDGFFARLVISWLICVSGLLIFTNPEGQGYRFVLNFPISILSGIGFYHAIEKLSRILVKNFNKILLLHIRIKKRNLSFKYSYSRIIKIGLVCFLFLSLFTSSLIRQNLNYFYIPYTPSSDVLDSLNFIRDHYKDDQLLFLIDNPNHDIVSDPRPTNCMQIFLTTRGMNAKVYIGNLFDLLSGKPSKPIPNQIYSWNYTPTYPNPTSYRILTIIPTYSQPDLIEKQVLVHVYGQVYAMKELSPSRIEYWNATWQKYQQTGEISNIYNDWEEHTPTVIADDGQSSFWTVRAWGSGSIRMPILSDDSDIKMSGSNSLKIVVNNSTNSGYRYWYIGHHYEVPLNISDKEFISLYWFGLNTGKKMWVYLRSPDDLNFFKQDFLDNFNGWNRLIFHLSTFSKVSDAKWDYITDIQVLCADENVSGIWYLDRVILDV